MDPVLHEISSFQLVRDQDRWLRKDLRFCASGNQTLRESPERVRLGGMANGKVASLLTPRPQSLTVHPG